jgi:hypothetical protein
VSVALPKERYPGSTQIKFSYNISDDQSAYTTRVDFFQPITGWNYEIKHPICITTTGFGIVSTLKVIQLYLQAHSAHGRDFLFPTQKA